MEATRSRALQGDPVLGPCTHLAGPASGIAGGYLAWGGGLAWGWQTSPQRGARTMIAVPGDTPSGSLLGKLLFSGRGDMQISLLWASRQHLWSHMRNESGGGTGTSAGIIRGSCCSTNQDSCGRRCHSDALLPRGCSWDTGTPTHLHRALLSRSPSLTGDHQCQTLCSPAGTGRRAGQAG